MRAVSVVRALCVSVVCAACVAAALLVAETGLAHPRLGAVRSGALIPSSPREILPLAGRTVQSANWSGYAVTSKSRRITAVSGTFIVPKVGQAPVGMAATWAGIGGYKTKKDLIQAGTGEDSPSGGLFGKQYFAWYELLPHSEQNVHNCTGDRQCTVSPGNRMSVIVRRVGSGTWRISMTDSGHWHWSKRVSYNSSRSSAEWILEAPSIDDFGSATLAPVGTVHFGPTSKYTEGGSRHTIAGGHPVKIILTGQANPSRLAADGQSFNDCAYRSSRCPRP